jgi:23S rRNA pseudouridine1911/1915/1917 synthase
MERLLYVVLEKQSGMRIDLFLAANIPALSRRKIRAILDVGGCYVNNKRMHIASRTVKAGDKVRVEYSLESLSKAKQKQFEFQDGDVLFDSDHIIAVNKPPGLPSQATRDQDVMHAEVCLRKLLERKGRRGEKLILLHRLDKETSGVLLFATLPNTATWITEQFRQRNIKKTYVAICVGVPAKSEFQKECFLSEIDKKTGKVRVVNSGGKSSKTSFRVIKSDRQAGLSLLECYPETGRSHQIRVHLESLGLPIAGDKRYGVEKNSFFSDDVAKILSLHHMLHAKSISFTAFPGGPEIIITASLPQSFQALENLLF